MTRLDYDIDNFSGRHSRGTRYNIYLDDDLVFKDVSEKDIERLYDRYTKFGYKVTIEEI